jgi:hypothetical protein
MLQDFRTVPVLKAVAPMFLPPRDVQSPEGLHPENGVLPAKAPSVERTSMGADGYRVQLERGTSGSCARRS